VRLIRKTHATGKEEINMTKEPGATLEELWKLQVLHHWFDAKIGVLRIGLP